MSTSITPSQVAAVVLAAGQGVRFRSERAKVLHEAAGRSLVGHVLHALSPLGLGQVVVVVGNQADDVRAAVTQGPIPDADTVVQERRRGTGHAVQQALPALAPHVRHVLVLPGDTPLLTTEVLAGLLEAAGGGAAAAMLTCDLDDATGYGRVLRLADGSVEGIVEERDASDEQRRVREANAGMYVFARDDLAGSLERLDDDNAQGELYLTDVVGILREQGRRIHAVKASPDEVAGVNDRRQLAEAAAVLRRRHLDALMEQGVTVLDPASTWVDVDVEVGRDTVLLPGTLLEQGTTIGEGARIGPHTHLVACQVGDGAVVHSTRGTRAVVGEGADVGPFTHLREGTRLGRATKAGAYVELKAADVGEGSKVPHLAYVGDATIGTGVNVSCGVVTVNYDGRHKHRTVVEDGAFVGCDTMLVAPVTIGAGAYTAAGSTITEDVPAGALAIARARQVVKDGWAQRRRADV